MRATYPAESEDDDTEEHFEHRKTCTCCGNMVRSKTAELMASNWCVECYPPSL